MSPAADGAGADPRNARRPEKRGGDPETVPDVDLLAGASTAATVSIGEEIEWYLLRAMLTAPQAASLDANGWFTLVWPEQWLLLVIRADRFPTVEAYQLPPRKRKHTHTPATSRAPDAAVAMAGGAYLQAWDVRNVTHSRSGRVYFPSLATTPAGFARRVMEAHRRGALRTLIEAACAVR